MPVAYRISTPHQAGVAPGTRGGRVPSAMPLNLFDAHLDLAYMAACGRDMAAPPDSCGGPDLPASITLPSLAEGGVHACLATVFVEAGGADPKASYPAGDADAAHKVGVDQISTYHRWTREGRCRLMPPRGPHSDEACRAILDKKIAARDENHDRIARGTDPSLRIGILLEGADPIRSPGELFFWAEAGVIAVGLAWARGSRYAAGNASPPPPQPSAGGLTGLGRSLVRAIDNYGLVHDVSHLSDQALADLLSITDRAVIASHSNCRALMDGSNQRHLTDETIREIGRRGGVVGLNLYSKFLREGLGESGRASMEDCVRHVEHVCELMGHRRGVGLGSDMDGGFSAARLPEGIDRPRDLARLSEALAARGWPDGDIAAFASGNWTAFWSA
jgi:membrane dipeptidase